MNVPEYCPACFRLAVIAAIAAAALFGRLLAARTTSLIWGS